MGQRLVGSRRSVKQSIAVAALALAAPAVAQTGDARNAATWYRKAIERLEAIEVSGDEWAAILRMRDDPGAVPDESVRRVLDRAGPVLSALRRGTRQDYSDFELDLSQGFDLQLPHLSPLRDIGRLMAADAALRVRDGNAAAAAGQIASLYRLAGHLASDGTMISSLVSQAIFRGADRVVESGLEQAAFGPAESAALREAMLPLAAEDAFGVLGALEAEQAMATDWIRSKYVEAADRVHMGEELGNEPDAAHALAGMLLMDEQRFESALAETERVMERVRTAFALDDPEQARFELRQIAQAVRNGEHGPLAMMMVPNLESVHEGTIELRDAIARRLAVLGAIEAGALDPRSLANAAVWYRRAFAMIRGLEPVARAQLAEVAASPRVPVDEAAAAATFAALPPIIDALRQGSTMPMCDFSEPDQALVAVPAHVAAMREAAVLLAADAVRHLHAGRPGNAADRLAICYRMAAHLATDPNLLSSVTAHGVYDQTTGIAGWGLELLEPSHRQALADAASAVGVRDPFGYITNQARARERLAETLPLSDKFRSRARSVLTGLNGDQLVYLSVVAEPGPQLPGIHGDALADVLDVESLEQARASAEHVRDFIAGSGDLFAVVQRPVPEIARVREHFDRARSSVGKALTTLRPAEGPEKE